MSKREVWTTTQVAMFFKLNSAASARSRIKRLGLEPVGRQTVQQGGEHLYDAEQVRAAKGPGRGVGGGRPRKDQAG